MSYEITDDHFQRDVIIGADIAAFDDLPFDVSERVGPKFSSVAAAILWTWSLDSSQDESSGDAQYGNGWHALFRAERAILHTGNAGFVSAWRIEDGKDVDQVWSEIEAGAVYPDEWEGEE